MKKWYYFLFAMFFILTGVFIDRYVVTTKTAMANDSFVIAQATNQTKSKTRGRGSTGTWVVKIDSTVITLDEFEREFSVHVYSLPADPKQKEQYEKSEANKKKFLTNLINEYLIYKRAIVEGYDKKPFVKDLLKAVTRRAIIQVYLNDKIEPKLREPSDQEIEAIYNQNKKLFAGVDIDVARQQIRMQLLQRQYNQYLSELIDELKGAAKVIKNENINL